jgi:hypothetical protein
MQIEPSADVRLGHGLSAYATVGVQRGSQPIDFLLLREHVVQWQAREGDATGLYVRVGRLLPVYGLRFAEHSAYTQRYGGASLYGEAYGVAVAQLASAYELHATAFVHDPLQVAIERGDGGAVYGEARLGAAAIGAQGRYAKSPDDTRTAGGLTAKYWLAGPEVLLAAEGSVIHQRFAAGGARTQLVSYLAASWFVRQGWWLDVGVGQFDEDLKVAKVDREALDVNLHWMATSHLELLLTNRLATIDLGGGGRSSGWSLLQVHYRL